MIRLNLLIQLLLINKCYSEYCTKNNEECNFFTIVIDAGSTGTRLHLYDFRMTKEHFRPFLVEREIFLEVKPGLSSYAEKPKDAAESIEPLLLHAKQHIPYYMWEKTPITLRATAGLRLLPGEMAENIMEQVERKIFDSGFYAAFNESVSIMPGSDEGVFSWFTLNILLENLMDDSRVQHTVPAFDLGGGSTQVTYWPSNERVFTEYPGFERDIEFFGQKIRLFTHSFLGNGLIAARLKTLQNNAIGDTLPTACLPEEYQMNWEYSLKTYLVKGDSNYSYDNCYKSVREFVDESRIMNLSDLRGDPIYLFSYFYDRSLNAGLVRDNLGGKLKLLDFKNAALNACTRTIDQLIGPHWLPWQCLDLTYIYSLLKDGYKFDDDQVIIVAKKIKSMEVSWGQGLAFSLANQFRDKSHPTESLVDYFYKGTNLLLSFMNIIET